MWLIYEVDFKDKNVVKRRGKSHFNRPTYRLSIFGETNVDGFLVGSR